MRLRCGLWGLAIALAACGSSSASPQTAPSPTASSSGSARCGPSGAHTLAASHLARVYVLGGGVYGCSLGGDRSFRLGNDARSIREERVGPLALAGRDAAYGLTRYGVDTLSATVIVERLSDGKQLHNSSATSRPLGPEFFQSVKSILVKSDGAVAWVANAGSIISGRPAEVEVNRADMRGALLLDSGAGIDPRSLRLHNSTVTWRHGSATRSATLR
jgi:hypothetical protein